ncbi:MAG: hypothetical protein Aureis2KO_02650 [Aureisphaera sp.]
MKKTFETIARFTYTSEAQVMRGRLESEGIPAFLVDSVTIDADPLVSNAIGGVKLNVYVGDVDRAMEILESISEFSTDDEGKAITCPNCGSKKVHFFSNAMDAPSSIPSLLRYLFTKRSRKDRYDYRCSQCEHKFM